MVGRSGRWRCWCWVLGSGWRVCWCRVGRGGRLRREYGFRLGVLRGGAVLGVDDRVADVVVDSADYRVAVDCAAYVGGVGGGGGAEDGVVVGACDAAFSGRVDGAGCRSGGVDLFVGAGHCLGFVYW